MKLYQIAGACCLMVGAASAALAQGEGPPQGPPPAGGFGMGGGRGGMRGGRGGNPMDMLFKGITLSQAQKDSLKKLDASQEAERRALFQSFQGQRPDSASMAKMMSMREKWRAQYRAVLTADQQKVYDKNVADIQADMQRRMNEWRNRGGPGGPGGPPPQGPPPPPPGN